MGEKTNYTIELSNLTKYYGSHRGIEDLTLNMKSGIIFGFLGPNGAGKTTTIRCLLGILRPTRGSIRLFGREINDWSSESFLKEKIGYLPGEFDLYKHFTVKETLDYFASLRKKESSLRKKLIALFDLDESRKVTQLSKGNKQKVGLVQALMHDPDLLILDEPTAGLDPLIQQRLYTVLKDFRDRGKSIFFSSHNLPEVQKIADEVAVIKEGFLVTHDLIEHLSQKIHRRVLISLTEPLDEDVVSHLPFVSDLQKFPSNGNDSIYQYSLWLNSLQPNFAELFQALNKLQVKDVVIPEPSLEDYFLQYYKEEGAQNVD
ncbi:MAG: ABC transporter ATP-binding protein [Candidatus Hodarchaeota archaeon]